MSRVMNRAAFFGVVLIVGGVLAQETAQLALPAITISVGGKAVTAEVMPEPEHAAFWMKNTTLPLSVAYINESGLILEIHDLRPLDEKPVPSAFSNIAYALEMEQGWFARSGIFAGDRIKGLPPLTGR